MRQWLARSVARRVSVFVLGVLIVLVTWFARGTEDMYGHGYNFTIQTQGATTKVYNQGDPAAMFEGTSQEAYAFAERMMDEGDNFLVYDLVIAGGVIVAALCFLPRPRVERRETRKATHSE